MKFVCAMVAGALSAVLLLGCGGAGEAGGMEKSAAVETEAAAARRRPPRPEQVWVTAEGWKNPADLGILMAQKLGYFDGLGIDPWFGSPSSPTSPVGYVVGGLDLLGVVQQPQVAIDRSKGAPIVAVGSLVSQPTAAMIWLRKSKIGSVADLKGKTIAIPGVAYQERFLEAILEEAGLTLEDVKVKRVEYDLVNTLLAGRADAIFGGSWNLEAVELETRGAKPVVTRVGELGVPAYDELVVIARTDVVKAYPQLIREFMSAVARGARAAIGHPGLAIKVVKEDGEANPEVSGKAKEAEVKATLPILSTTAYMDPGKATGLLEWMHERGMTSEEVPVSGLLSNDYLEGTGER